ncbi:MAG: hypothetical protein JRI68_16770 [Deltaproteobacteria bacterium]|nr:hypothetical protein [Deltaproteobacteria bacterium]
MVVLVVAPLAGARGTAHALAVPPLALVFEVFVAGILGVDLVPVQVAEHACEAHAAADEKGETALLLHPGLEHDVQGDVEQLHVARDALVGEFVLVLALEQEGIHRVVAVGDGRDHLQAILPVGELTAKGEGVHRGATVGEDVQHELGDDEVPEAQADEVVGVRFVLFGVQVGPAFIPATFGVVALGVVALGVVALGVVTLGVVTFGVVALLGVRFPLSRFVLGARRFLIGIRWLCDGVGGHQAQPSEQTHPHS